MSHMVIYRGVDGKPGYHQTDDIHDAVNFVEKMRSDEGVEHARVLRLEEVVFEYRPYYRVELTSSAAIGAIGTNGKGNSGAKIAGGAAQVGTGKDDEETVDDAVEVVEASDGDGDAGDSSDSDEVGAGKKGLFGR